MIKIIRKKIIFVTIQVIRRLDSQLVDITSMNFFSTLEKLQQISEKIILKSFSVGLSAKILNTVNQKIQVIDIVYIQTH